MGERGESESTNAAYSSLLMRTVWPRARKTMQKQASRAEYAETLAVHFKMNVLFYASS